MDHPRAARATRMDPGIAGGLAERRAPLRAALRAAMRPGEERLRDEGEFTRLALDILAYQMDANPVYGAYVRRQGIEPGRLGHWREIPPVPATAFRELPLHGLDVRPVEAVFRTSGTRSGVRARGTHRVRDLSLYHESLLRCAADLLGLDPAGRGGGRSAGGGPLQIVALTPSPGARPDSSLVHMLGVWMKAWDPGGGRFLADAQWRFSPAALRREILRSREEKRPLLVAGTAFGFRHLVRELRGDPLPEPPAGSFIVETGGFKGRVRRVSRAELYLGIGRAFRLPSSRIVSEYGMTELLSQFYEPVLLGSTPSEPSGRHYLGPPWTRTAVLDPGSLAPAGEGEAGMLCHIDLANLDSVAAVLTEDLGIAAGAGFRLLGRAEGAEPRGCSLAMEELLEASRRTGR